MVCPTDGADRSEHPTAGALNFKLRVRFLNQGWPVLLSWCQALAVSHENLHPAEVPAHLKHGASDSNARGIGHLLERATPVRS